MGSFQKMPKILKKKKHTHGKKLRIHTYYKMPEKYDVQNSSEARQMNIEDFIRCTTNIEQSLYKQRVLKNTQILDQENKKETGFHIKNTQEDDNGYKIKGKKQTLANIRLAKVKQTWWRIVTGNVEELMR